MYQGDSCAPGIGTMRAFCTAPPSQRSPRDATSAATTENLMRPFLFFLFGGAGWDGAGAVEPEDEEEGGGEGEEEGEEGEGEVGEEERGGRVSSSSSVTSWKPSRESKKRRARGPWEIKKSCKGHQGYTRGEL